jgi:hypothetical protein
LSPLILTPSVLQTTIQDIQVILDKDYNGYKVLTSDPNLKLQEGFISDLLLKNKFNIQLEVLVDLNNGLREQCFVLSPRQFVKESVVKVVSFCIFTIPCHCALITNEDHFSSHVSSCNDKPTNFTKLHPVDLALLQHFLDESRLSHILGNTTFSISIICGFKISVKNLKLQECFISDSLLKNKFNIQLEVLVDLNNGLREQCFVLSPRQFVKESVVKSDMKLFAMRN